MTDYTFHRAPSAEQRAVFERSRDLEYFALFWDPRCGKSQPVFDTFAYNCAVDRIDTLVVLAYPSDVHLEWVGEAYAVLAPEFVARSRLLAWRSGRMGTKVAATELAALLSHAGPVIFTMNCEAINTVLGYKFLMTFMTRRKVLFVVDEDWATNWSARTRRLLNLGKRAVMRRLLTGTPAEESPYDLYYPCTFLCPGALGFTSATAFRARYTLYEQEEIAPGQFVRKKGFNRRTGTHYDIKVGYQNLEELGQRLRSFSDRVVRKGSLKVYAPRYFSLTDKQRRVYDRLRDEFVAELGAGEVGVAEVLRRMALLQRVARNYFPPAKTADGCTACMMTGFMEDGEECDKCDGLGAIVRTTDLERVDTSSPACDALEAELRMTPLRPFVVWCKHNQDVTDALEAARRVVGDRVARYDRLVPQQDRKAAYDAFRAGEIDGIVATEKSGLSRGHQLAPRLRLMVYYSNEFSARDRRQSEDRGETAAGDQWYDVVDLIAADTRDLTVIEALREKKSIAALVTGDAPVKWL